ncbi:MAG: glycoside hydrolase family 125 protein [Actinobacteria bacterium]|nr:glycoside hydrolase family 125 protein [Actinomycetota bacterium]
MGNVNLTTESIFPGLASRVSENRFARVDRAVQGLLSKTLKSTRDGLPFIITGDIPAMWLRDSTWQVKPLLESDHPQVIELLVNLSKSQVQLFLKDPYANAFNPEPNGACWHKDFPDQSPWVFERKYELDSWASLLYLARKIFERYGVTSHLDAEFKSAVELMINLGRQEQNHDPNSYVFLRENGIAHDSLSNQGRGAPIGYTGMIYSAFRPSDDACTYGYLVPSNFFFMNELRRLPVETLKSLSNELASEIAKGIEGFALIDGKYAYEVDGHGNTLLMDDANVPSLLSLPYIEAVSASDPNYQSTRAFILSPANPYFFAGSKATGIGSQHTPQNHVWPIAIAMAALTSEDRKEKLAALDLLEGTDAGTGQMHESFHVDDDQIFTREWFSWSDMTYVDLVLSSVSERKLSGTRS